MNVLERSFIERIIDCPLNVMGKLPVFLRDRWNSFGNVMLLGHELLLIINFANLVNAWYLATKSIWLAFLLALFVDKFIVQLFAEFMIRRNLSKNTLIDDKFFN